MRGRRGNTRGWLALLLVLPTLLGCSDALGPYDLSPEQLSGAWLFRAVEPEWCTSRPGATLSVEVRSAERTSYGRVNLRGEWAIDRSPAPHIPERSTFSGSVDLSTGDFELVLWTSLLTKGEMTGMIHPDYTATSKVNWGVCRDKVGAKVGAAA